MVHLRLAELTGLEPDFPSLWILYLRQFASFAISYLTLFERYS
jgi:hypothetical protein